MFSYCANQKVDIKDIERHVENHYPDFCATGISSKGLKEGSVTLRYLGVLPSDVGPGVGTVSRGVAERPGASSTESKEVRNVFMIFPG